MHRIAASLSILAAAGLAACTSYEAPPSSSERAELVTRNMGYQPGTGVVQSVSAVPGTAGAGATAAGGDVRLAIRMDDGDVQYVDTSSREFAPGTRVRLTEDRVIMRE